MSQLVERLTNSENLFWVAGTLIALTAIISGAVRSMVRSTSREKTRREIAAYIAEGTMTPEQGEKGEDAQDVHGGVQWVKECHGLKRWRRRLRFGNGLALL